MEQPAIGNIDGLQENNEILAFLPGWDQDVDEAGMKGLLDEHQLYQDLSIVYFFILALVVHCVFILSTVQNSFW